MSRLVMRTVSKSQEVVEDLYKVLERRIVASPPGICPVDISAAFLKLCHAQSCGKVYTLPDRTGPAGKSFGAGVRRRSRRGDTYFDGKDSPGH